MLDLFARVAKRCNSLAGLSLGKTYLYKLAKTSEPLTVEAAPRITWKLLAAGDVSMLSEVGYFDGTDAVGRFQRGDLCYLAYLDGRLAHYSWVQRSGLHPITEAGRSIPVAADEFWIYHCLTADWARGQRTYPTTLQRIVAEHFANGYATAWIYTSQENIASQKGILRAGFEFVSTLKALRIGRRYKALV